MSENNDREQLYEEYYNEHHKSATYSRNNRQCETNAFQRWERRRNASSAENIQLNNLGIIERIRYDDNEIIIVPDKTLYLNDYKLHTILNSKIEVVNKIIDKRKGKFLYTLKSGDITYPSYTLNEFIKELGNKILKGTTGRDVISYIITEKAKKLPEREGKYVNGHDNGWYLPFNEDEKNFGIICYNEEQRSVYNNCKEMYKKYSLEEKEKLKIKLQQFVELTDMSEAYKAIIIGCCMINPFRLYFIDNFSIFPHLNLFGRTTAGKTHMLDSWSTNFYKNRLTHMSGKTASSPTRIEGAMTASTFPTMVDDYKETTAYNTAQMEMILKDSATGRPLWKRLFKDGIRFRAREVISSILTTSQTLGELMNDSALLARTISLPYEESIESNEDWIKLELELKKEKPFSLMYDATKSWKNKHLYYLMKMVDKTYHNNLKLINPKIADLNYPKLLKIYKIILAGCLLAKMIYKIKLEVNDIWDVLVKARRTSVDEFLNIFLSYCEFARNLDPDKPIPRILNLPLEYNVKNKVYVLKFSNLRDFIAYYAGYSNNRTKFKLNSLFEKIKDALEHKELIKLKRIWHNGKTIRAIWINPVLIQSGDSEPTKGIEEIAVREAIDTSVDEEYQEMARNGKTMEDIEIEVESIKIEDMGEDIEISEYNEDDEIMKEIDKVKKEDLFLSEEDDLQFEPF